MTTDSSPNERSNAVPSAPLDDHTAEELLNPDNIDNLVELRTILLRLAGTDRPIPFDCSAYKAASLVDAVINSGSIRDVERLPDELQSRTREITRSSHA